MKKLSLAATCSLFAFAAAVAGAPALAQPAQVTQPAGDAAGEDQEIVITAQRREERSVDVPVTVTSLGEEELQTSNVQELADIAKITSGLRFDFAGSFFTPTIRGVGTSVVTSGGAGNVGVYVDGFYSPNPLATNLQLIKVENIQVLKGPQGTLFGRNTTGGAILVKTADPSTETSGQVKVSYGRFNEARLQGYATFGLTDRIAFDVEGLYRHGDGWQRDISNNRKRVGRYDNWTTRAGLKVDLTDSISVLLRWQHSENDDPSPQLTASYFGEIVPGSGVSESAAPASALPGQFTFDPDEIASGSDPEFFHSNSDVFQGTIRADLGFADFTSYSQYRREKVDASIELDYSGADVFQLGLPIDNETLSQEFLLTSKPGKRLQWTAGLFYMSNRDTYLVFVDNFPAIGIVNTRVRSSGSSTTTKTYAAFADVTYEAIPDRLFVTGGLRYSYDKITDAYWYNFLGFPNKNLVSPAQYDAVNGSRITPRFVVRYKPTDQSSIYASYAKGYKAGLLDVGGATGNPVDPEKLTAYELGFKHADSRFSAEVSAFYYDYKDLQVSIFIQGTARIVNAAKSKIYGLDAQFRYDVTDAFQINAGGTWVHARNKEFTDAPIYTRCTFGPACGIATFIVVGTNLTDTTMQRTPKFSGNIGARYIAPLAGGELVLSGNLYYTSKFFFGPSGIQFPQKGYETLSLRAQWNDPSDHYFVALWGDNVTNDRHLTQVQYNNPGIGANWSKPRTYGIELGAKF